jgi:hypothetical protein
MSESRAQCDHSELSVRSRDQRRGQASSVSGVGGLVWGDIGRGRRGRNVSPPVIPLGRRALPAGAYAPGQDLYQRRLRILRLIHQSSRDQLL